MLPVIQKAREAEAKEKLIAAAYNAWQIIEALKAMLGSRKGQSFADYLDMLQLEQKPKLTAEEAKKLEAEALAAAERIKSKYKGGKA